MQVDPCFFFIIIAPMNPLHDSRDSNGYLQKPGEDTLSQTAIEAKLQFYIKE